MCVHILKLLPPISDSLSVYLIENIRGLHTHIPRYIKKRSISITGLTYNGLLEFIQLTHKLTIVVSLHRQIEKLKKKKSVYCSIYVHLCYGKSIFDKLCNKFSHVFCLPHINIILFDTCCSMCPM